MSCNRDEIKGLHLTCPAPLNQEVNMASKAKKKKEKNSNMINGVKCTTKLRRVCFYNSVARAQLKRAIFE